ncbi:AAA family ATPase [Vibrio parahaemolyticus]|nr:AAA family ATPase [Vibrio parahaemolyticus]
MIVDIEIEKIQHINRFKSNLDLSLNKLYCIVGRNGVGKTTLLKSIKTITNSDVFLRTSNINSCRQDSFINFTIDGNSYRFTYDKNIRSLNSRDPIPPNLKDIIDVELAMPFGERFNYLQNVGGVDSELRRNIILEKYDNPIELITLLNSIYDTDKFNNLVSISIKNKTYFCRVNEDYTYIREDHFSSGEYFVISLYRKIKSWCKLIVVDEIDISLDSAAQVKLVEHLRVFCKKYFVNIVFTSHSLALMKTLKSDELYFMTTIEDNAIIEASPYNYVKSNLFGFCGWDKYILTEDDVLKDFLKYLISKFCNDIFFTYKIIYIGGSDNICKLITLNNNQHIFSSPENVIAIYDGDQKDMKKVINFANSFCIPLESVEKCLYKCYYDFPNELPRIDQEKEQEIANKDKESKKGKALLKHYEYNRILTKEQVFSYLADKYNHEVKEFCEKLQQFLTI